MPMPRKPKDLYFLYTSVSALERERILAHCAADRLSIAEFIRQAINLKLVEEHGEDVELVREVST